MSSVPKETIEVIAQSIGITNLSPDVALALAPDLEYRIREIMQESIKCMRHSMRTFLTTDDVDSALALRNLEPLYGFTSNDPVRFKRAAGHKDLFYIDDKDVDIKDLIEAPLPKAPLDTSITSHWLAIEGVQPAIPENAPVEAPSEIRKSEYKEDGLPVDVKLPVKHVITRELQLYYEKIIELTLHKPGSIPFRRALVSLATDSGLHPLIPYFTRFVADEVAQNLNNLTVLFALMRLVRSLLQNSHIHIELYLHQLMPPIITCVVAKRIGNRVSDNHWELRNFSANLVASICQRFGHVYHNLQPRVTKTFLHSFLDPSKALPQHYGAIKGIAALGSRLVRLLILPNLEPYLHLLEPEMQLEKQSNEMKRQEAWQVYGALLDAVGRCMHEKVKKFSSLLSPPTVSSRSTGKAMIAIPDGPGGVVPMNSMSVDMQGSTGGFSNMMGVPTVGISSMGRQLSNDNALGREIGDQQRKVSSTLAQAWKEDMDAGHLLSSVYELFGKRVLPFVPKPEACIFL
ncbi:transcription initiation factor TFIID subunit 6-like isoform X2 [Abrus precatorius]|uniref:Transcription initiation factor TFIID subunit 6-like isoform X2 n=1 Tax=Abrus precatorius TaxID=3816 RepID=A0A8B8KC35_ABRPR|nr:transcription initiation factor TFIID subunit 6-like isoform X2 [Abrus precatorius]